MKKYAIVLVAAIAALSLPACGNRGGESQKSCSKEAAECCRNDSQCCQAANPVIDAIMSRRSIRKYKDTPVEREKLQLIAECGVNAPNGMNAQRWEVRIVDSAESIAAITEKFKKANPEMVERDTNFKNMFRNAPAVIFVAVPEGEDGLNAGLLGENIMLAAHSLGLGTVCLGGPVNFLKKNADGKAFLKKLDFSEGYSLLYMIGVGYPDETPDAKPRDLSKIRFVD